MKTYHVYNIGFANCTDETQCDAETEEEALAWFTEFCTQTGLPADTTPDYIEQVDTYTVCV